MAGPKTNYNKLLKCLPLNHYRVKHDFPFINIRMVPREVLKTVGESLLLHKFNKNTAKI